MNPLGFLLNQRHLIRLFDTLAEGVLVLNIATRIRYLNAEAARILRLDPEEAVRSTSNWESWHVSWPDGRPLRYEELPVIRVLQTREPVRAIELAFAHAGRERLFVQVSAIPLQTEPGELVGVVVIFTDITERKQTQLERERLLELERQARQQAESAERRAAFLADASEVLASSLDYEQTLQRMADLVVPELADWCGIDILTDEGEVHQLAVAHVDPEKVTWAKELRRRYPPTEDPNSGLIQVLKTRQPAFYPYVPEPILRQAARDEEHWRIIQEVGISSAIIVPLVARDRTLGAVSLVLSHPERHYTESDLRFSQDLARRAAVAIDNARLFRMAQQAEAALSERAEALERSNRELEQFAYVASHDLKEPLRMITGYTQLIQRQYQDKLDPDAAHLMTATVEGAKHMNHLIEGLLTYSRIGRKEAPLEPVDLNQIAQVVLASLDLLVEETDAEIECGPLPWVLGEPIQLLQLLQNLVSNALKFRDPARPLVVRIRAERQGAMWKCSVSDTGIGIEPRYQDRIFQLFQRLHTRRQYEGTGIGLAVCKKIVEHHGGEIWVESEPGHGSSFYFTLPAGDAVKPPALRGR